jgi:hypothetical protein
VSTSGLRTVRVPGRATLDDLDEVIASLTALTDGSDDEVILDLSGLHFIGPTCIAVLVASCCSAEMGRITRVQYPRDGSVRAYLERMDAFELIPSADRPASGIRRKAEGFRECRRFRSLDDCVDASRELVGAIDERCSLDNPSRQALTSCIAELAENVYFHAACEDGGYAVAQSWPRRHSIEVGIVDMGRGIRGSLAENAQHASLGSDQEAIARAFELGTTATPERNTGQGLFSTARLLEKNGGHVLVRSGRGWVYDGARTDRGDGTAFPGTLVSLTIDTRRPLDAGAVAYLIGELKGGDEDADDLFD